MIINNYIYKNEVVRNHDSSHIKVHVHGVYFSGHTENIKKMTVSLNTIQKISEFIEN